MESITRAEGVEVSGVVAEWCVCAHTCVYVRVRSTGEGTCFNIFINPLEAGVNSMLMTQTPDNSDHLVVLEIIDVP